MKVKVAVKLNDGTFIDGSINLRDTCRRISDHLNNLPDLFVTVCDVTDMQAESFGNTVVINKNSIAWIQPKDPLPRRKEI